MENNQENSPESFANGHGKDTKFEGLTPDFPPVKFNFLTDQIYSQHKRIIAPENELSAELKSRIIDLSIPLPDLEFLFELNGVGSVPLGDFVVLKGKQKAGKSTLIVCWIVALVKGQYMGFIALKLGCLILYIDTEQNPANTRKLVKKINSLCSYPIDQSQPNIIVINLRGDNPDDRFKYIFEAVGMFKPDLLIIDGIKDLVSNSDINDPKTSGEVVQKLMTISKDNHLAIVTILHENKNDNNLRGHLGTEAVNKCSECWQVKKVDRIFEVEQTDSRNQPAEAFSFTLDEMGLPVPIEHTPIISIQERTATKRLDTFRQCLPPLKSLSYTDLSTLYCEYYGCSISTAHTHISTTLKHGFLTREPDGIYKFNYQRM